MEGILQCQPVSALQLDALVVAPLPNDGLSRLEHSLQDTQQPAVHNSMHNSMVMIMIMIIMYNNNYKTQAVFQDRGNMIGV